jgi:hypothetical protein
VGNGIDRPVPRVASRAAWRPPTERRRRPNTSTGRSCPIEAPGSSWNVAVPVARGLTYTETAARLGRSRKFISEALDDLGDGIEVIVVAAQLTHALASLLGPRQRLAAMGDVYAADSWSSSTDLSHRAAQERL